MDYSFFLLVDIIFQMTIKKKSYRSYKDNNEKILIYSKNLPILKSDTNNVIEYIKQTNNKKKKKFNFWKLLDND